jgi:hypothetical protein
VRHLDGIFGRVVIRRQRLIVRHRCFLADFYVNYAFDRIPSPHETGVFLPTVMNDVRVTSNSQPATVLGFLGFLGDVMHSLPSYAKACSLIAVSVLSACATSVSVDDLYKPNFGRQVFPHFDASADPDPMAITNGLYASPRLRDQCYLCSPQSRFNSAAWAP